MRVTFWRCDITYYHTTRIKSRTTFDSVRTGHKEFRAGQCAIGTERLAVGNNIYHALWDSPSTLSKSAVFRDITLKLIPLIKWVVRYSIERPQNDLPTQHYKYSCDSASRTVFLNETLASQRRKFVESWCKIVKGMPPIRVPVHPAWPAVRVATGRHPSTDEMPLLKRNQLVIESHSAPPPYVAESYALVTSSQQKKSSKVYQHYCIGL